MTSIKPRFSDLSKKDPKLAYLLSNYEVSQEKIRNFIKYMNNVQKDHPYIKEQIQIRDDALKELDKIKYNRENLEKLVIINLNGECCDEEDVLQKEDVEECCDEEIKFQKEYDEECCDEETNIQNEDNKEYRDKEINSEKENTISVHNDSKNRLKTKNENNSEISSSKCKDNINIKRQEGILKGQSDILEKIASQLKEKRSGISHNETDRTTRHVNQLTGKIMDTEEINIAGQIFYIRYDEISRERRKEIFLNHCTKKKLTDNEKRLLTHLSITGNTYDAVKMYLYDFFESLPHCQTTGAILSKRRCEVAYHLLWSVLLKARQDVQRKIDDANTKNLINSKLLQYQAQIKSLTNRDIAPYMGPKPCDESHDEHMEIESMIKRLGNKVDRIEQIQSSKPKIVIGRKKNQKGGALQELQRIYDKLGETTQ
jgi:hypothetical protein